MTALERAIKASGGTSAVAKKLGVSQPVVSNWIARKRVPAAWAISMEQIIGIPRYELRPDVFQKEVAA
jgi:DNA-binding transcriptional regulator YdaS (Cro superfamily)